MKVKIVSQNILKPTSKGVSLKMAPGEWRASVAGGVLTVSATENEVKCAEYIISGGSGPVQDIDRSLTLELSREDLIQLFDKAICDGLLRLSLEPCNKGASAATVPKRAKKR